MRLAYVSAYDSAGQRFNGMVLHRALLAMGHQSDFAVELKSLADPRVHTIGSAALQKWNRRAAKLEARLSRRCDLSLLGFSLLRQPFFRRADVVHLQLLHARSFLSLRHLPAIANGRRPVVWTLHDPWIMAGHCVHSLGCDRWKTGCGMCPDLKLPLPIHVDRTARNWQFKRRMLSGVSLHIVVASSWMDRRVADSPILRHLPRSVIPFGIDPAVFRPLDPRACRARLGIPAEARVAAVRWTPHNMLKGTRFVEEALLRLPEGVITHVLCFDTAGQDVGASLRGRFSVLPLGWTEEAADVAVAMNAADVFLMPSLGETFGMMAIEALACGTPVVVFEGTSLPDVIQAPRAGIAVPREDAAALADAVVRIMSDRGWRDSLVSNGLALAAREYTEATYVSRHLSLYEELIRRYRQAS